MSWHMEKELHAAGRVHGRRQFGVFEEADGGALFPDEIAVAKLKE